MYKYVRLLELVKAGTFLPEDNSGNKSWNGGSTTSCSTVRIYLAG